MKNKLLVQQYNSKFIQNVVFSKIEDTLIIGAEIKNNLYKIYYTYNPTHIILVADILTSETIQFISDFCLSKHIYIYHKNLDYNNLVLLKDYTVTHILHEDIGDNNYKYILYTNDIVNNQLFFEDNSIIKQDSIVCFLDDIYIIPDDLNKYLYPNSKLPIKLFNNPKISHPQNLGILNESVKSILLRNNKYYLSLNSETDYSFEAINSGCCVIETSDLNDYTNKKLPLNKPKTSDHIEFIKERILI